MTTQKTRPKALEEYRALPYRIVLTPDEDEEGRRGFVAEVVELPGCMSQGATPNEAVEGVRDAMAGWISVALEDGRDIPEPGEHEERYSGKFLVRMPRGLHASLARTADAEGVSINQFVVSVVSGACGWMGPRAPA